MTCFFQIVHLYIIITFYLPRQKTAATKYFFEVPSNKTFLVCAVTMYIVFKTYGYTFCPFYSLLCVIYVPSKNAIKIKEMRMALGTCTYVYCQKCDS